MPHAAVSNQTVLTSFAGTSEETLDRAPQAPQHPSLQSPLLRGVPQEASTSRGCVLRICRAQRSPLGTLSPGDGVFTLLLPRELQDVGRALSCCDGQGLGALCFRAWLLVSAPASAH